MTNGPASIGIIMDGNRRYAKERGLPATEGHRQGMEKVFEVMRWAREEGIQEMVLYAFSTENWNRSAEEVGYLMELFEHAFGSRFGALADEGVRIRFIGEHERAPASIQKAIADIEERTKDGANGTLAIAFSYGGRAEILSAVNSLLAQGKASVNEDEFRAALWSRGLLDPDLILRTGGESRLSNFLPWQSVYSELFFTDTKWPALTKGEFTSVIAAYRARDRRHGK